MSAHAHHTGLKLRHSAVLIHRYAGLFMAAFLIVIGLTGSIIVFNSELTRWLDPPPRVDTRNDAVLDGLELRDRAQALYPKANFNYANLHVAKDQAFLTMTGSPGFAHLLRGHSSVGRARALQA